MTLTISTGDKRFSMKLAEDECHQKFYDLVLSLIGSYPPQTLLIRSNGEQSREALEKIKSHIATSPIQASFDDITIPKEQTCSEPVDKGWDNMPSTFDSESISSASYKGFLYVECSHCGKAWGFNAKEDRSTVICRECGNETELSNMVKAYVNCQCGRRFKYQTNHTSEMFDINCLDCGSPVPLGFNKKKGVYETL